MADAGGITFHVPESLRWDEDIIKAFQECAPYHLGGRIPVIHGREIRVATDSANPLPANVLEKIGTVIANLVRGFRDIRSVPLNAYQSPRSYADADVFAALEARAEVILSSPGVYRYAGGFLATMRALDALIADFAYGIGAVEEDYPAILPIALLHRSGYLKAFPHHALFVAPVRFDQDAISAAQSLDLAEPANRTTATSLLNSPSHMLAPTVCYHAFNARQDAPVAHGTVISASSHCHRFETGFVTLERLMTFRMREIVFFGDAEHVQERLDHCLGWFEGLLRSWGISFQTVTASDPFFANAADSKRLFQAVRALKREVKLYVPATDRWISVASFNNHADSLVKAFAIEGYETEPPHSGCVGFGLERLLYGLYCAWGLDAAHWPDALRASV
jgi:seryl-tRNA synthetase